MKYIHSTGALNILHIQNVLIKIPYIQMINYPVAYIINTGGGVAIL